MTRGSEIGSELSSPLHLPAPRLLLGQTLATGDVPNHTDPFERISSEPPRGGERLSHDGARGGRFEVMPSEYRSTADGVVATRVTSESLISAPVGDWIFYLNRRGGAFNLGINESRSNRTSLLAAPSALPEWDISDEDWNSIVGCVSDLFADYRVTVVDEDPQQLPHIEAVFASSPQQLLLNRQPEGLEGISPFEPDCSVIENSIVFVFGGDSPNLRRICEIAAQELAHSFGLDHEYLCEDPMTYLPLDDNPTPCGDKFFVDQMAPCGEDRPRECAADLYDCGRAEQNSVQLLSERLGRRDEPLEIPEVIGGSSCASGGRGWAEDCALVLFALAFVRRRRHNPALCPANHQSEGLAAAGKKPRPTR